MEGVTVNYRIVISGGPCSGKTSLLRALQEQGFTVHDETVRSLVKDAGGFPIRNKKARKSGSFFRNVLKRRIEQFLEAPTDNFSFFDRGLPDSLAYMKFMGSRVPALLNESIKKYRYNNTVFLLPPWQEIYSNDAKRKESFEEAQLIFNYLKEAYNESGYMILELPKVSVNERVNIILSKIIQ